MRHKPPSPSRWPLFGMIAAGSLAAGSVFGALAGNFAATGGLHPGGGWQVPSFGAEVQAAELPPPAAKPQVAQAPSFVGYYPAQASDVADPALADRAAHEFDALFDQPEPVYAEAHYQVPDDTSAPVDDGAYWERGAEDVAGDLALGD